MKLVKVKDTYNLPYTIHVEWTAYLIFSTLLLPIVLVFILTTYANRTSADNLIFELIILAILSSIFICLKSFKIILKEESLCYKYLFFKSREILYSDIQSANIEVGITSVKATNKPFYRLNLYKDYSEEPLTINMKSFSKRDLAIIIDRLVTVNPGIVLDELSQNLIEGNFKPIVNTGIRRILQLFLLGLAFVFLYGLLRIVWGLFF